MTTEGYIVFTSTLKNAVMLQQDHYWPHHVRKIYNPYIHKGIIIPIKHILIVYDTCLTTATTTNILLTKKYIK